MTDVRLDSGGWISGPSLTLEPVSPGAAELLFVVARALERSEGNAYSIKGVLRVLLATGTPADADCRTLATVLGDATMVSNDPEMP